MLVQHKLCCCKRQPLITGRHDHSIPFMLPTQKKHPKPSPACTDTAACTSRGYETQVHTSVHGAAMLQALLGTCTHQAAQV